MSQYSVSSQLLPAASLLNLIMQVNAMTPKDYKRKLTAILSADVKEYSRLMREDEDATIRTLTIYREKMTKLIGQFRGRVVDS